MVYISEAHSTAWPTALPPRDPQKNLDERIKYANEYVEADSPPFEVYVDKWDNEFAETLQAWPDKYYLVDKTGKVLAKSEYYQEEGEKNALIKLDCVDLIEQILDE